MSLGIDSIVDVQVDTNISIVNNRDFSMILVVTDENNEIFKDDNHIVVSDLVEIEELFGIESSVYAACEAIFSVKAIKKIMIGKRESQNLTTQATYNQLIGSEIIVTLEDIKALENKDFKISIGGTYKEFTELDFSEAENFEDIATILSEAFKDYGIKCLFDGVFTLIANEAGSSLETQLGFLEPLESQDGDFIGDLLALSASFATVKNGEDEKNETLKDSVKTSLNKIWNENQNFYGIYPAQRLEDDEIEDLHDWIASNKKRFIGGYTALKDSDYLYNDSNIFKKLADKNSKRFLVTYNNTSDIHAGAEFLAIALSMDWTSSNSFGTLKFKSLTTTASDQKIKVDVAEKLRKLGINFYTDYDGTSFTAEGTMLGKAWADETLGLDAFADTLQKELALIIVNNNIKQTDRSHRILINCTRRVCEQFRKNGFFAEGNWHSKEFGSLEYGDYLDSGYYIYSDSYDNQNQTDREARKAMPILVGVKFAGAVHSASSNVNYNQ